MNEALEILGSLPFAIAVTALLRKRWPQIDGWFVPLVVALTSSVGAIAIFYRDRIPAEVWIAVSPILTTILAMGTVQTIKHATGSASLPQLGMGTGEKSGDAFDASEAPTLNDRPTVPPEKP